MFSFITANSLCLWIVPQSLRQINNVEIIVLYVEPSSGQCLHLFLFPMSWLLFCSKETVSKNQVQVDSSFIYNMTIMPRFTLCLDSLFSPKVVSLPCCCGTHLIHHKPWGLQASSSFSLLGKAHFIFSSSLWVVVLCLKPAFSHCLLFLRAFPVALLFPYPCLFCPYILSPSSVSHFS